MLKVGQKVRVYRSMGGSMADDGRYISQLNQEKVIGTVLSVINAKNAAYIMKVGEHELLIQERELLPNVRGH